MKALSVKHPWVELVARGDKSLEVRSWRTNYRGSLVLVSSSQPNRIALQRHPADGPRGVTYCLVELVDVRPGRRSDSSAACCQVTGDDLVWVLASPRRLDPVPIKGRLNLYEVPDELVRLAA